jgi:alkylation response protein AidB-like acyl-CoA dehydrogenase
MIARALQNRRTMDALSTALASVIASESLPSDLALTSRIRSIFASDESFYSLDENTCETRAEKRAKVHDALMRFFKLNAAAKRSEGRPLISVRDQLEDPMRFLAAIEGCIFFDMSFVVKVAVHFELFGGTILYLGNDVQRATMLDAIDVGDVLGCFCMTEIGHGSNLRALETTATLDMATDEWVITTPTPSALKIWIGNAATYANTAVVWAKLHIDGVDYGLNAFVVTMREDGELVQGIRTWDCGAKVGWNGVDNAVICFDDLRVPRSALLDRLATVDAAGTFTPVAGAESSGKRFAAMLQQLVLGRIMYIGGPAFYLQQALTITIRYASQRRQFGPPGRGESEVAVLKYPAHQSKLMRPLARVFVLSLAGARVKVLYTAAAHDTAAMKTVHPLIAGLKAVASEYCFRTICELRSACGGHGFLAKTRLGNLRDDIDVFRTAEGENTVMLQQLAASLVKAFSSSNVGGDPDDHEAIRGYVQSLFPRNGAEWDADCVAVSHSFATREQGSRGFILSLSLLSFSFVISSSSLHRASRVPTRLCFPPHSRSLLHLSLCGVPLSANFKGTSTSAGDDGEEDTTWSAMPPSALFEILENRLALSYATVASTMGSAFARGADLFAAFLDAQPAALELSQAYIDLFMAHASLSVGLAHCARGGAGTLLSFFFCNS